MNEIWTQLLVPHLINIVTILAAAMAIVHILTQVKKPSSMIAWILFIVIFPYLGILLYILLSGRKIERIIRKKGMINMSEVTPYPHQPHSQIERLLCRNKIACALPGNNFILCADGIEAYQRLLEMIQNAKKAIYISTYILGRDEVTETIVGHLAQKAKEGIEVKILMDSIGSKWLELFPSLLKPLKEAGGEYHFFMSVFKEPFNSKINLRNHRKMIIVDGERVMSGGMNIAREYLAPRTHEKLWADISFIVEGRAAYHYLEIFRSDWESQTRSRIRLTQPVYENISSAGAILQVVPSGPDIETDALYEAILQAIALAQKRIWIVTPYFIPDASLLEALTIASHRGVDVQIVVPDTSDHPLVDMSRIGFLRDLAKEDVTIRFYKSGMLHAKAILIDETLGILGSANFDVRSFFYNFEVSTFLYTPKEQQMLRNWIEKLYTHCDMQMKEAGSVRIVFENVFKIVAPIL